MKEKINKRSYWIKPDGKLAFSAEMEVNEILMKTFTE